MANGNKSKTGIRRRWWKTAATLLSERSHTAPVTYVRGEAGWIAHNGELLHSDKVLLGQGDVMMFWQKDDCELMGGTVPPHP